MAASNYRNLGVGLGTPAPDSFERFLRTEASALLEGGAVKTYRAGKELILRYCHAAVALTATLGPEAAMEELDIIEQEMREERT